MELELLKESDAVVPSLTRGAALQRPIIALMKCLITALSPLAPMGAVMAAPPAMATAAVDMEELRLLDRRVATVAYRLATHSVDLCPDRAFLTGLVLHDLAQYWPEYRQAAKATFKLDDYHPGVLAIVGKGPADAGGVREDDLITAIHGVDISASPLPVRVSYALIDDTQSALEAALKRGPVRLRLLNEEGVREVVIEAVPGCISRVELTPGRKVEAASDGRLVEVSGALARFVASDDELAVIVGHEMAHNILRHADRLDRAGVRRRPLVTLGRSASRLRATELDADYLGLYLAARAGYDITAAIGLWLRFGRRSGLVIFPSSIYPDWRQREHINRATINEIASKRTEGMPIKPQSGRFILDIP